MDSRLEDFVSNEKRAFKFKLGELVASSVSGFIAGVIFASIIWGVAIFLFKFITNAS